MGSSTLYCVPPTQPEPLEILATIDWREVSGCLARQLSSPS